jgi:predicted Zn-dependent peptidase
VDWRPEVHAGLFRPARAQHDPREAFTSRLNNNLREVHGYAWRLVARDAAGAGSFYAAAGVQTDKTSEASKEFFNELTRIHETVDAGLDKAKNYLALQLPRNFETTRATANALAQAHYDLPSDYYATYGDRVRAVTAGREARRRQSHPARQVPGRDRRRSQGHRSGRESAEPRAADRGGGC